MWYGKLWLAILAAGAFAVQGVEFIAHRGESLDAPENTMSAFRLAWERGADGVECDVHLTRDGHVVICHDENTKRTSGVDLEIAKTDWSELRKLDVGSLSGPQFAGERIPLLRDLLATVPVGGRVFIELKSDDPALAGAVRHVLEETELKSEQVVLISFHAGQIERAAREMPEYEGYLLAGWKLNQETGAYEPGIEPLIRSGRDCRAVGLDLAGSTQWPPEAFTQWREAGFLLGVWTIDDIALARYYVENGVDAVTSNRAAELKKELSGEAAE